MNKKISKLPAVALVAIMLFALCACGDNAKKTESGKNPTAVSNVTSDKAETEKNGDNGKESDDGFILPEDGKIEFGKNNKKTEETTDNTDKDSDKSGKDPGKTSSEIAKPTDSTKPTEGETATPTESETPQPTDDGSSTGGNPADDNGWSGVQWNR